MDWLKNSTSNGFNTTHSFKTSTQHNDDFYFAGDFWRDLTIDGLSIEIGSESANGFILKMDESGTASGLWPFKSSNYVRINAIEVNPVSGSLIATGYYRENLIYNNQVWNATFYANGFVMSINPDGTLDWIKQIEPQDESSVTGGAGLTIDDEGNIFVEIGATGNVNIDDQSFQFDASRPGVIIAKFNVNGELIITDIWKSQTFEGGICINDMAIDNDNQLIIVGCALGTNEIADSNYVFSNVSYQPIIIKQDNDLNLKWLKTYQSMRSIVLDVHLDENDLVLSLQYNDLIIVDENYLYGSGSWGDMAIISLDENAELNWVKNFPLSENGGNYGVYGLSITGWNDQYFIGGMYQGDVVHEGSLILNNSQSGSSYQYPFILSLSKEGEITSAYDFVGSDEPGLISTISANESHLLFGGDFSGRIAIGDSSVSTINSALFYGALTTTMTGIEVIEDKNDLFEIYPTLSSDYLHIKTESEIRKISLISSMGMLLNEFSGDNRVIDVNDLTAGFYYLSADIDGKMVSAKFIKQ